ncbi:MAG: hypothetical protein G01um101456_353 [Parcubacteria group bacterium Gr01-1014_56]|nr:MAG: hypothetical protein G01um101456_353 [Parcubacteria group bacterium Gr01-1014_56]
MSTDFIIQILCLIGGIYFTYASLRELVSKDIYIKRMVRNIRWRSDIPKEKIEDEVKDFVEGMKNESWFSYRHAVNYINLAFGILLLYVFLLYLIY